MINDETIRTLALEVLEDEYFIVEIRISKGNNILVSIDGDKGVSIERCVQLSRHIESGLERDVEDFELSVDWAISWQGNSGIFFHVQENSWASWATGPEYSILDDEHPKKEEGFDDNSDVENTQINS